MFGSKGSASMHTCMCVYVHMINVYMKFIILSPCLLGMLWEITDADIDKMTTNFMSNWIPSSSEKSWAEVDVDSWSSGTLS